MGLIRTLKFSYVIIKVLFEFTQKHLVLW